jgi:hypothetical protein
VTFSTMKSSPSLTATKMVIRWLRWAAVVALVYSALAALVYAALGPQAYARQPAPLAAVGNLVFMLHFYMLREMAFVVAGALMAPRFRLTTAIVLAALHVLLSLWIHVLSRVSLAELVLFEGGASYRQFTLEALGAVLGVAYIYWSEKTNGSVASALRTMKSSSALSAAKTVIRWLRWATVLAVVCTALGNLVYSGSAGARQHAPPLRGDGWRVPAPAPLAVVQGLVGMLYFYVLGETAIVVAGALLAPRFGLTTAIVLAALHVSLSFWGHVLATGGPWWSWTINYTHFSLEAFGSVLGVVHIYWLEKVIGPYSTNS